ncbi:MAG: DNA-3-methyladenine glycosylase [Gammaproteobacteria bacterium]
MDRALLLKANRHLRKNDPIMAQLIKLYQPFSFNTKVTKKPNHFHTVVRTIISQQLSVKAAQTIQDRLLKKQGGRLFNPKKIQILTDTEIRQCGLSKNKVRYLRAISLAINDKELVFSKLEILDDEEIIETLIHYPGIGLWSAEMILMISFKRLDILPLGDLIIRKSMQLHYGLDKSTTYDEYREIAAAWQPYRTIASRYLWASAAG